MTSSLGRRSLALLLVHSALIQAATFLIRPATTYRALELDVPDFALGALAATYALFPLLLAIPTGALVDRLGEKRLMVFGSLVVLACASFLVLWGQSVPALIVGNALLGAGQLACVVGQQAAIANNTAPSRLDAAFGYLTFAASLGQALGPLAIAAAGGASVRPDTQAIFALGAAMGVVLTVTALGVSGKATRRRAAAGGRPLTGSAISLLKTPGVAKALVTSSVVLAVVDLTVVYLPALGEERGISAGTIGLMLAVRAAFSMVSRLGLGALTRRVGRTRLLVSSLVLATLTLAATAVPMPTWLLFIVLAGLGLGLGIGQPLTMSWLSGKAPEGQRGRALALRLAGNRVGQLVLPTAVGAIAASLGAAGVLLASAVVVGATLLTVRGVRLDEP